jgi:hypothetical protein
MGEAEELKAQQDGGKSVFALPPIERGAIVWVEGK